MYIDMRTVIKNEIYFFGTTIYKRDIMIVNANLIKMSQVALEFLHKCKTSFYVVILFILLLVNGKTYSQDSAPPDSKLRNKDSTGKKLDFNETDFGFTTARIGMAFMNDWAWYSQDAKGKQQLDSMNAELENQSKVRDVRIFFSGKIKPV